MLSWGTPRFIAGVVFGWMCLGNSFATAQDTLLSQLAADQGRLSALRAFGAANRPDLTPTAFSRYARGEFPPPAPLTAYLQSLADRLLRAGPVPEIKILVTVDDCPAFSDEADPNALLIFCFDTLRELSSESELSFLIAHEIGHLLLQHFAGDDQRQKEGDDRFRRGMRWGLFGMEVASSQNKKVEAEQIRSEERQADAIGIDLVVAAGLNPVGAVSFFEKVGNAVLERQTWQKSRQSDARNQVSRAIMRDATTGSGTTLVTILSTGLGLLADSTFEDRQYDRPAERGASASEYINAFYLEKTAGPVGRLAWASGQVGSMAGAGKLLREIGASQAIFFEIASVASASGDKSGSYRNLRVRLEALTKSTLAYHNRTRARLALICTLMDDIACVRAQYEILRKRREAGLASYVSLAVAYSSRPETAAQASKLLAEGIENSSRWVPSAWAPPARMAIAFALLGDGSRRRSWEQKCRQELDQDATRNRYAKSQMMRDRSMMVYGKCDAMGMFQFSYGANTRSKPEAVAQFFADMGMSPY